MKTTHAPQLAVCAALAMTLVATPASAQQADVSQQSDIKGSFELKLGGYYPVNIDSGTGSFEQFYGSENLLMGEFVYERYLFQRFGKLGIGGHVGFTRRTGEVQTAGDTGMETGEGEEDASAEVPGETTFRMVPVRGSLFYRYDYSALNHRIPLAPIARVGLDYVFWWVLDGDGEVSESGDDRAQGGKYGWHASIGLQLMLDYLDPSSAASFDLNWGINNSYLFAEYMITRIDNFGSSSDFDLSDNMWMFGLAFEF